MPNTETVEASADDAAIGVLRVSISPRKMAFKRFVNNRAALVSSVVLAIIVLYVVLAPITTRYGINQSIFKAEAGKANQNLEPSSLAWFGTDANGRDLYSRIIYGAQVSLMIGLFTGVISVAIGTIIGCIAGFKGGRLDDFIMRITDVALAMPGSDGRRVLRPGEPLDITVTYEGHHPLRRPSLTLDITAPDGQVVHAGEVSDAAALGTIAASGSLTARIGALPLQDGTYVMSFSLADRDDPDVIAWRDGRDQFDIVAGGQQRRTRGLVSLDIDVSA